jgi:outer membrane biosynthesis protein TonB
VGTWVRWRKILIVGAAVVSFAASLASGQQAEEGKRKTKTKVNPVYPDLARRMSISGKVKIEVIIAPDGRVSLLALLVDTPFSSNPALKP